MEYYWEEFPNVHSVKLVILNVINKMESKILCYIFRYSCVGYYKKEIKRIHCCNRKYNFFEINRGDWIFR